MSFIFIFVAVLLLLIVIHELGHFLAAKWSKMRVLEFGVGFPPKIAGKKVGDTEYTINWIPFGGFVRIFGEDPKDQHDPAAFVNRPAILQAFVLFAGPFANIVLAVVLTMGALMMGAPSLIDEDMARSARDVRVIAHDVVPESPAEEAGIRRGDRIAGIVVGDTRTEITTPSQVTEVISSTDGDVGVVVLRGSEEVLLSVTPALGLIPEEPLRPAIGISMALVGTIAMLPHDAALRAVETTYRNTILILVALSSLIADAFTLSADVSSLAGPVGIATLTGEAASFGFGALLTFAALLSINLAIINLLPFPALDGGRLLFLFVESVSRRKIPLKVANALNAGGFMLLIALMIGITIQDITRLW